MNKQPRRAPYTATLRRRPPLAPWIAGGGTLLWWWLIQNAHTLDVTVRVLLGQ